MEMASYLAGERWSDHPACTHPLLAALARHVNDLTSDSSRQRLAPLIPSVIGLTGDDPHIDVRIALRWATTALPYISEERQRVMALSVLSAERVLSQLDDRGPEDLEERSRRALAQAPAAERWARQFERRIGRKPRVSIKGFRRYAAPNTVRCAVEGIALACVRDADDRLYELLVQAIDDCRTEVLAASASSPADETGAPWTSSPAWTSDRRSPRVSPSMSPRDDFSPPPPAPRR
jgi:hypothetical protein